MQNVCGGTGPRSEKGIAGVRPGLSDGGTRGSLILIKNDMESELS